MGDEAAILDEVSGKSLSEEIADEQGPDVMRGNASGEKEVHRPSRAGAGRAKRVVGTTVGGVAGLGHHRAFVALVKNWGFSLSVKGSHWKKTQLNLPLKSMTLAAAWGTVY